MSEHKVSLVRFERGGESVRRAVEMCEGLSMLKAGAKAFIKPNVVFWTRSVDFPKWGVITTSRVVEDMVQLLKEHGVDDITIGEGIVTANPKDMETPAHAFASLGYHTLRDRYGVKVINVFERPFEKVSLSDGVELSFNADILHSDLVVDLPVMKTHAQTVVSLGIKNLKGTIDVKSRKQCHNADPERGLHFHVSKLAEAMPPILTVIDGIYTSERGPGFDGRMHRSNLLAASRDVLSADLVGARLLGQDPAAVPYLALAARHLGRPLDLSDVEVVGESLEAMAKPHEWYFPYTDDGLLPLPMAKMGIKGLSYKKYDDTLCTYCSGLNGAVLASIAMAWKGTPWNEIEVLTGKRMAPTPGMKKTILLGKCMYQANKDHPDIKEMLAIKGCPPKAEQVVEALQAAGIEIDRRLLDNPDAFPGSYMKRYQGKAEFDPALFQVA
ncbi:MAG: DUF362 domain-containing protein [Thermodesulfobacteriota bacterium]